MAYKVTGLLYFILIEAYIPPVYFLRDETDLKLNNLKLLTETIERINEDYE